jgi:hypothetical protein
MAERRTSSARRAVLHASDRDFPSRPTATASLAIRMSSNDSTSLLEEAFANVHRGQDPDGSFLDEAVRSFTDEMKAVGWTPEQVIVAVKRAANRSGAMMRKTPRSITEPSSAAQLIVSQAVSLSIEHYFSGDGKKNS